MPHALRSSIHAVMALAFSCLSTPLGATAAPITYEVFRSITNTPNFCQPTYNDPCFTYTLEGTVTTDGTVGDWGQVNHFTDISLVLSDGTQSVLLDQSWYEGGGSIVTTATEIRTVLGYVNFFDSAIPESSWILCSVIRAGCWETVFLAPNGVTLSFPQSGGGSSLSDGYLIGVVPEPSTAVLLATGLLGLAARRRMRT